jgi:radical SAM superfamily enzyme YgiQ (UPF0313 family)
MRFPLKYDEPLFRPPSEAYSLIFQVTKGCSWNQCAFCEMYTTKDFKAKKEEKNIEEIAGCAQLFPDTRKVFLADGDAMALSTRRLLDILNALRDAFPRLIRVGAYASTRNLISKSPQELKDLREAGLKIIYVGIESGDDVILERNRKGESFDSTVRGLNLAHDAGIQSSVMILSGLGGTERSTEHALQSARVLNETQPHFASTLVLSFPFGKDHYRKRLGLPFDLPDKKGLLTELQLMISHLELKETIFRSDHASNYLSLKGILNRDREKLLMQITEALERPASLRPEWMRGL